MVNPQVFYGKPLVVYWYGSNILLIRVRRSYAVVDRDVYDKGLPIWNSCGLSVQQDVQLLIIPVQNLYWAPTIGSFISLVIIQGKGRNQIMQSADGQSYVFCGDITFGDAQDIFPTCKHFVQPQVTVYGAFRSIIWLVTNHIETYTPGN